MESSRQKTFKQQRTIQSISAVFVFILQTYPSLFSANQFKGARVAIGTDIRAMSDGKGSTLLIAEIEALEAFEKRHESGYQFLIGCPKHLAGRVLNSPVEIKPTDTDRYRRILGVIYLKGTYINLGIEADGLAEIYHREPGMDLDNNLNCRAERVPREDAR